MKPTLRIPLILPIALAILCSSQILGQILARTDIGTLDMLDRSRIEGVFVSGKDLFCLVESQTVLDRTGRSYSILDSDPATGSYFWVQPEKFSFFLPGDLSGIPNTEVLWRGDDGILVRAWSNPQRWDLSPGWSAFRVRFQKAANPKSSPLETALPRAAASPSDWIQTVLDEVNLDSMLLTVRQMAGEEPYWHNGTRDTILTRYSYSPNLYKSQNYLESRLTGYGYEVTQHSFFLSTFSGLRFAEDGSGAGWLIAEGKIYGTSDGGESWSLQYENSEVTDLSCLASLDSRTALAVGEGGAVVRTGNAGAFWKTVASPTSEHLFDAFFLDDGSAWICGDRGTLYRTPDLGESWEKSTVPTSTRLRAVFFFPSGRGWVAGDSGLMLRTLDSGTTWSVTDIGTDAAITSIHFLDEKTGWAVVRNGKVLKTSDSGETWITVPMPKTARFESIRFFDDRRGIILGSDNTALATEDGGETWESLDPLPGDDLVTADMSGSTLWILGRNNAAFRPSSGSGWEKSALDGTTVMINNIITQRTGTVYPEQYVIICAHYDAISNNSYYRTPGADDNASGCAAVIEAARIFSHVFTEYTIRFVLFPGEEQGLVGSREYAYDVSQAGDIIKGVINIDMIAWDGDDNRACQIHCGQADMSSYNIGEDMEIAANEYGLNLNIDVRTYGSTNRSDHASFWNVGYPAVLLIEDMSYDFNPFYHSTGDTTGWFNLPYFLDNAKLALAGVATLAVVDSADSGAFDAPVLPEQITLYPPYPNPFNPNVFFRYELPAADEVHLVVTDILGRPVKSLFDGNRSQGRYQAVWNGMDENGRLCGSGIYIVTLKSRSRTESQKMVLVR